MSFDRLFSEATIGDLPRTGDVLAVALPLLRQLHTLHEAGMVTGASGISALDYDGEILTVRRQQLRGEQKNLAAIDDIAVRERRIAVEVTAHHDLTLNAPAPQADRRGYRSLRGVVVDAEDGPPSRPVFVRGYRVWEQLHGHHDELTDIALAGFWLCSYAFALDLDSVDGIGALALHSRQPGRLNPSVHPVVASVLGEMISPDRSRRSSDLRNVIARLEHHRDIPADLDLSDAYLPNTDWRRRVLSTLRDRVFDTTRRNRELYFRPTGGSVSLTEASVPLMLNVGRIRPEDLLTWTEPASTPFRSSEVDLARWCRFEESPYLGPALDRLIAADRQTRVETGHGRLRLIIAFLQWFDPEANEPIVSPLLTLPALLTKRKGIEARFRLATESEVATVNPVLAHVFNRRFGIVLPETVGVSDAAISTFITLLEGLVQQSAPALKIERITKPRIELLRRSAELRVDSYRRRRAATISGSGRWRRHEFSYEASDWRPLGQGLYDRFVRSTDLPLRAIAGAPPRPRFPSFHADTASDRAIRTNEGYFLSAGQAMIERWQVDLCNVTLAMLGSRRTSLARDYEAVLDDSSIDLRVTPFEALFRPKPTSTGLTDGSAAQMEAFDTRQMLALPVDAAQAAAVQRAVAGDSFIIQGPPGTGKSQTIANVIAALVGDNKRVLFVCEKRAAIDVVAHRLDQAGLGDLTALIHDSQLDRKRFVRELGATYGRWVDEANEAGRQAGRDASSGDGRSVPLDGPAADHRRQLLDQIDGLMRPLTHLSIELGRDLGEHMSVAHAIERLAGLERGVRSDDRPAAPLGIGVAYWFWLRPHMDRVNEALGAAGLSGTLGNIAALRVAPGLLTTGDPIGRCRELGRRIGDAVRPIDHSLRVDSVGALAGWIPLIAGAHRAGTLDVLDPAGSTFHDLRLAADHQEIVVQRAHNTASALASWSDPPTPPDAATALEVARAQEPSFFKFLNGRWREAKELVERSYRFDQHQIRPTITAVLDELVGHHRAVAVVAEAEQANLTRFGHVDARALRTLAESFHHQPAFEALRHAGAAFDATASAYSSLAEITPQLLVNSATTVGDLARLGDALAQTPVSVERALVAWSALNRAEPTALANVLDARCSIRAAEAAIIRQEIQQWADGAGASDFSGARIDDMVATLRQLHTELLASNSEVIVERARARFWSHLAHSEASMAGRSPEDKERKRAYVAGRRVIEREARKKMRHRSIRELSSGESQLVVRDLRPVWLMSPLSVADTLPLQTDLFDTVIFDEASQIAIEDAIPCTFRSPQVIVVGDRMQMPPTRFFSTGGSDDTELVVEVADDEGPDAVGHRQSITLDSDSFLTQAEEALSSTMLNWHYRSRFESLIAYSNHAFYQGRLATVPDQTLPHGRADELVAHESSDATTHLVDTLARPISFHFMANGRYQNRRNAAEADYVAEMVRAVLREQGRRTDSGGMTVGVVAFSEAQQGKIEAALEELASIDPEFGERYEAEQLRVNDGEFVGLFIKNLENVQGDERDIIIMSVCYGPDADGRIRMNFGPINNPGGERRLNVIFSRAKQHMVVVSSIRGSDITNLHNEGARHLAGFLSYAEAESQGNTARSTTQLRGLVGDTDIARRTPSAVASALADALTSRGWDTEVDVGRSDFRVDVAIAKDGEYLLGILLEPDAADPSFSSASVDSGTTDSSVLSRYVAEAGVLEGFGWSIMRVTLSDWFNDRDQVVERVHAIAAVSSVPR